MTKAIRWSAEMLAEYERRRLTPPALEPAKKAPHGNRKMAAEGQAADALARRDAARKQVQALGRLKTGQMNKSEQAYAALLESRKSLGEVLWYRFEGVKLVLAKNTSLTVDFFVLLANGELHAVDVKGSRTIVTDDAWAKLKIAAEQYPFRFFVCFPNKGEWDIQEI